MIMVGIGRYGTWRLQREAERPGQQMCRAYLGCCQLATRTAYDRLYNTVPACGNHGRSVA